MNWKWPRLTSCLRITLALLLSIMTINPISVSATTFVDLTRDPDDITLRKTEVVEDAVWIRIDNGDPDDDATGTGYFNSFLRLQKSDGERGYNSNLDKVLYDELKSFTDAELLSVVPYVEYGGRQYREFQLDINENDDYLVLNRLQIWVTEHENLIGSTYPGGVHAFTEDQTVKVYDTGDNVIMLSYRGGSGNREYKVLVPAEDFPDMTYVVIYTEMGFPDDAIPESFGDGFASNDGFEEWGVKVMTELPPVIDVVKTALVTSVPEPGAWVTYKVDIANSSGMTDPVTINSLTDAIEGATAYSISGMIFDDVGLLTPTTFPFTIQPGMTKTVYFKSYVSGEPRTVNDIVTASGVDDEGTPVSDFDDADVIITDVMPIIEVVKVADPLQRDEPGGLFTYTYRIYNHSVEPVMLTKVEDDVLGVLYLWETGDAEIWIGVGAYHDLVGTFTETYTDAGEYPNIVDAWAKDNEGNSAHDDDNAMVEVIDVMPIIEVVKVADPLSRDEPGGLFTYTYRIYNHSVEPVMLTKVEDDVLGVLYLWETGDAEIWIGVGEYHDLVGTFTETYTDAGEYPNIVDAWAKDNEGNTAHDDDNAMVEVIDVLPIIEVVKVADPLQRNEPGGLFTYTYRIYNHSVEPVMLTMVEDDILGVLYEWETGDPEIWIGVGSYHDLVGTFTKTYTDAGEYPNIVDAWAMDNEENMAHDDDDAMVEVIDVLPVIEVVKMADPLSRYEPGGLFTYTYRIYNRSVEPVMLTLVEDDILGVLYEWESGDPEIWIGVGSYHDLVGTFTKTYTDAGEYPNIVDAWAMDNEENMAHDDDDAMVEVIDVLPVIELVKTADPLSRYEPGGLFAYTYRIYNHSVEPVKLMRVEDDILGVLYQWVTGDPEIWIPVDGSYLLPGVFTESYTDAGWYRNVGEAWAEDNEDNTAYDDDEAMVEVIDVMPQIELVKTATPLSMNEPGGVFTYTYRIYNLSVEPVMLTLVEDDILGVLYEWESGDPEIWIEVGGNYLLPGSFTKTYTDAGKYPNIAEAHAEDDEGNDAEAIDDAEVEVIDVLPTIRVDKVAAPLSMNEPGGLFTYTYRIYNLSVEPVMMTMVEDDILGVLYEWETGDEEIWIGVGEYHDLVGTFTKTYTDAGEYPNVVDAWAKDNEENMAHDDDNAMVEVIDVLPVIEVVKMADPLSRDEPGGLFTYTYRIYNLSVEPVMLTKVEDDILGVLYLWETGDEEIWIGVGAYHDLVGTFTKTYTDAGEYPNIVDAYAKDNEGNTAHDDDNAMVEVIDVLPTIRVDKVAAPLSMNEPGGVFTYTYRIYNLSVEPVMLTKVEDDVLGVLYLWETGDEEIWIGVGSYHDLVGTFTKTYTDAGEYPNIVDAWAMDNEENMAHDDDDAMVEVIDVLPVIELVKTADPLSRYEPGGLFTYTFTVYNHSVEPVWLTEVVDDKLGTLYEWVTGMPKIWIPVDGSYLLPGTFTKTYTEAGIYPNIAIAYAEDNEGNSVHDDDSRSVTIIDVLPEISITKTANKSVIPFSGEDVIFTFVITNHSVEDVVIYSIDDTIFGDLLPEALVAFGDDPIVIAAGQQFTFTITRFVSGMAGSEHYNVVTACGMDNEQNTDCDDDDELIRLYWYGFTPGYWKNHAEEWYRTDYMPMDKVRLIFGITHTDLIKNGKMDLNKDGQDDTLMDALGYKGGNDLRGKVQILLRAAVAGLLNESALGDYYPPYDDVDELIMAVNAAINTSNKTIINNLAGQIDYWNNGIHEFPD
jgi:hypothetical protein